MLYCGQCGRPTHVDELARFGDVLVCPECKNSYAQKLREGVVGTAAVEYGGFWIRFVAALIDGIILGVVGSIIQFAVLGSMIKMPTIQPNQSPEAALAALLGLLETVGVVSLINMVIACIYEAWFVSSLWATPGKMALGLKVVRSDGSRLTLGRAVGRYFAKLLSSMILLIGYIMAGFDSQKRALHDLICDTRVIKVQS